MADVNVLVIGSDTDSSSYTTLYNDGVASVSAFDPADVVSEFTSILGGAGLGTVNVTFEDLNGVSTYLHVNLFSWFHFPFPLGTGVQTSRWANLRGENGTVWDYVVLLGDAHSMEYLPGFYALGVSEIVKEVAKGTNGTETVLLMPWPASGSSTTLDHYKEVVYRVGRSGGCAVAPAGLAWADSGESSGASHPTANGAYIAAATLYSRLFNESATNSTYSYNDTLADSAHTTVQANQGAVQYTGTFATPNPYSPQYNTNRNVDFSITGTSTERGHIDALEIVLDACRVGHSKSFSHRYNTDNPDTEGAGWPTDGGGDFLGPIDYNFGKFHFYTYEEYNVNTNFWKHTYIFEYQQSITEDTALGLILNHDMEAGADAYMLAPSPGAIGATIPRASWAMLYRLKPNIEMNGSGNHLTELAILPNATFINTVDSGRCPLTPEVVSPTDEWDAMRVGYEAGWIMSRLQARAPGFRVLPSAADKQEINNTFTNGAEEMTVQFIFEPEEDVTVHLSSSNPSLITISPSTLTFTPGNHDVAQSYTVSIANGASTTEEEISVVVTTTSDDEVYHALSDSWTYTAKARGVAALPVAVKDDYRVGVNKVLTEGADSGVIANDISNPLSPITQVTLVNDVNHGSLNLSNDGSFVYSPDTDFEGVDSFTYNVTNVNGSSSDVTVTIAVSDSDPSLILWYEFEEINGSTVVDSTAYGRDGTIISSIPQIAGVATGTFGADLTGGTIDIPIDQEFYDLVDNEISIAFWGYINPVATNSANSHSYILKGSKAYDGTVYDSLSLRFQTKMVADEYILYWENGIYTQGSTGSTTGNPGMYRFRILTADSGLTPGDINDQWVHWTFTRDRVSGFFRVYMNGVLVDQDSSAGLFAMGLIDEMDDLVLGDGYKGSVDDFRIYNREISVSEIAEIMVESSPPSPQTWTGNDVADNLWVTPGNWSLGTLPEAGQTLDISNGDTVDVTSAADFPSLSTISLLNGELAIGLGANLDLQSGSVLNVDGGSITRGNLVTGNVTVGVNGESSLLDIRSGSIQFIDGSSAATPIYSDLTIRGGDIDIADSQTRIYGALTIQGRAATIDFEKFKGFAGSTIHFELDEVGVSPINVSNWAQLEEASITIDGSSYTGGVATIQLLNSTDLRSVSSNIVVTGLEDRGYSVQVNQDQVTTDDVTLVITVDTAESVVIDDDFSAGTIANESRIRLDDVGVGWIKHADSIWSISGGALSNTGTTAGVASEGLVGQVVSTSGLSSTNTHLKVSFDYTVGAGSTLYFHLVGLATNGTPAANEALANTGVQNGNIQNQSETDFGDLNLLNGDDATGVGADTVSFAAGSSGTYTKYINLTNYSWTADEAPGLTGSISNVTSFDLILSAFASDVTLTDGSGAISIDNMELSVVSSAGTQFDIWANSFGLEGIQAADPDGDSIVNLMEYALGGDPTNGNDLGILPVYQVIEDGGFSGLEYVYRRRLDNTNLAYTVQSATNLVSPTWSTNGCTEMGTGIIDATFESVTNRIDVGDITFGRLKVEQ